MEDKELDVIKQEIIDKAVEKLEGNISTKYVTMEELKKSLEAVKAPIVPEEEPGGFTKFVKKTLTSSTEPIVPAQYVNKIFDIMRDYSIILKNATVINVSSNTAYVPYVETRPTVVWIAEGSQITGMTEPSLANKTATIKKAATLINVSNELLSDAAVGPAVDNLLMDLVAKAFVKEFDKQVLVGATTPWNGIASLTGATSLVGAGYAPTWAELHEVIFGLSSDYMVNPVFVANKGFYALAFALTASTAGSPMLDINTKTLLGYPYYANEDMDAPSSGSYAANKVMAIFGDLKQVIVAMRQDLTIETTRAFKFDYDLTSVKVTARVGVAFPYEAAFLLYKSKAT
ncbi:MAG: phage major capsid protein [Ignavibacteriales bacterium]|nr:phage major capsid protein [Ignavibacteriales bacterium]